MNFLTIVLLGIGLAMDAFTVSVANSMSYPHFSKKDSFLSSLSFGLFQGIMPLIGYLLGSTFSGYIEHIAPFIAFFLLSFLGIKMIVECIKNSEASGTKESRYTYKEMFIQAIATSIDAFAIGITLSLIECNIIFSCLIIAIVTFIFCILACFIGKKLGQLISSKAEIIGGAILLFIGLKILVEYLITLF